MEGKGGESSVDPFSDSDILTNKQTNIRHSRRVYIYQLYKNLSTLPFFGYIYLGNIYIYHRSHVLRDLTLLLHPAANTYPSPLSPPSLPTSSKREHPLLPLPLPPLPPTPRALLPPPPPTPQPTPLRKHRKRIRIPRRLLLLQTDNLLIPVRVVLAVRPVYPGSVRQLVDYGAGLVLCRAGRREGGEGVEDVALPEGGVSGGRKLGGGANLRLRRCWSRDTYTR